MKMFKLLQMRRESRPRRTEGHDIAKYTLFAPKAHRLESILPEQSSWVSIGSYYPIWKHLSAYECTIGRDPTFIPDSTKPGLADCFDRIWFSQVIPTTPFLFRSITRLHFRAVKYDCPS